MSVLRVCSVNVGRAGEIGTRHHQPVISAIGKQPITSANVVIGWLNIDGDEQADHVVHGGIDKAVYVYPEEHFAHWQSNGIAALAGTFGENITSRGLTETDVHFGDRWTWGTSELIVTQPRVPCYKLALRLQRPDVAKLMINTATCGWYLRVLRPGIAATTGPMHCTLQRADSPTIFEAFAWALRPPRARRPTSAASSPLPNSEHNTLKRSPDSPQRTTTADRLSAPRFRHRNAAADHRVNVAL